MDMPDKIVSVYFTDIFEGKLLAADDLVGASWHSLKDLPKIKFNGAELIMEAAQKLNK